MNENTRANVKLVGIAGASGSGKSFFAQAIKKQLSSFALILSQDDYYKDRSDIPLPERERINYDHPDALDFDLLVDHLRRLKNGLSIEHPLYDFAIHNRKAEAAPIGPAKFIVVDGILLYTVKACRDLFDVKVFVDTPKDICFIRRLQRDVKERGRSVESVVEQYLATVRPMFDEFVQPTVGYADFVVQGVGDMKDELLTITNKIME